MYGISCVRLITRVDYVCACASGRVLFDCPAAEHTSCLGLAHRYTGTGSGPWGRHVQLDLEFRTRTQSTVYREAIQVMDASGFV